VATIIVQNGTLRVGDTAVSGFAYGRIRAMTDDKGRTVKEAGPSMAVSVLGFQDVPSAGDVMFVVEDEKLAKQVAEERSVKQKIDQLKITQKISLDDVFTKISEGQIKDLNLIVKADVQGSVEAVRASLNKLSNAEVKVNTVHGGVGAINKSDLMLAEASRAIIIGFNVRPDAETKQMAEAAHIDIRLYKIIYDAIDDVNAAIKGMLAPKFKEQILGHAEVRNVFKLSSVSGVVAGCYITDGKVMRTAKVRVYRADVLTFDGNIDSLKRFKDDVKEVASGFECGITIGNYSDIVVGDVFEAYVLEKVE
jgi:translation initiation factor IF-2